MPRPIATSESKRFRYPDTTLKNGVSRPALGGASIEDVYNANTSIAIHDETKVTANFAQIDKTATLTMAITPDNSGTTDPVVGTLTVPVDAYTQIQAIPADGYFFEKWTVTDGAKIKDSL